MNTIYLWIAAIVVFVIIEGVTAGLASIWFAIGAVAGLVTDLMGGALWLQIVWFFVVSLATLLLTRPLAKKYVNARTEATNADRIIGKVGVVTETIDNVAATGAVKIEGQVWTARAANDHVIPADTRVIAREIRGVKLFVEEE